MNARRLPMLAGQWPLISTLRGLLEASAAARREGDIALAGMLEGDAELALRASLQAVRREAGAGNSNGGHS
jgi:hypothetical protein